MRILLASANDPVRVGGIERFVTILADGLAARGHEVMILCCRYGNTPPIASAVETVRLPASYALDRRLRISFPLPAPGALLREARRLVRRAEVVHVQDVLYPTSLAVLRAARRAAVPSVLTQHVPFVPLGSRLGDALQQLALTVCASEARRATRVVAVNPSVAAWASERLRRDRVDLLPIGVPAAPPAPDRAALRRQFGLPEDRFVAAFVGRDVPKKGLDVFLDASDPGYLLLAVTDRTSPASSDRVRFLPLLRHDELLRLLGAVDAFVLPSEAEGLPMTMQEALAAGVPVVTTDLPGYDYFFSPDDVLRVARSGPAVRAALLRLAADETLREELSARGSAAYRRHFSAEAFVEGYEGLYAETVMQAATGRGRPG